MRPRTLTLLAALFAVGSCFLPADAAARRPAPTGRSAAGATPRPSAARGPTTHQLGLAPAPFRLLVLVTEPNGTAVAPLTATDDPLYSGWCDLYSFGAGARNPTPTEPGSASLNALTLERAVDATTTTLFSRLVLKRNSIFTFVIVRDAPDRIESWKIRCTGAYLAGQQFTGDDYALTEADTIAFAAMEWSYLDTGSTGKVLNEIYTGYDITTRTATNGTRAPTYPGGLDTDGDGVPDGWELYYGFNRNSAADALTDPDGDGQNNLQEYVAGTVPTNPKSVLRISAVGRTTVAGGTSVVVTWNSVANKIYQVQSAPGPGGSWKTVATAASAGYRITTSTVDVAAGTTKFFYRVVVTP